MSFPRYPKYKDSGVEWLGELPAHWDIKKLKHVSPELTVGIVVEPSKLYAEEGVPALRSLNVNAGAISLDNLVFITQAGHELHSKSRLRAGDIVAVRTGQPGTAAVVPQELDGCNCIDLIVIRRPTVSSERFLCWYLGSDSALAQFSVGSGGAIQQHFNISTAAELVVAVPPLAEQTAITTFLDREAAKIDALVAEQQRLISLLKEKRQAVISHAVTKGLNPDAPMKHSGVEWLGEVPAHWDVVPLKWLTDPERPIMYGIVLPGPDAGVGVPILKGGNVKPSRMNLESMARTTPEIEAPYARARLKAGDLVYSIRGSIGDCEPVPDALEGANITQDVARVAISIRFHAGWARWVLLAPAVREELASGSLGAAVRGINIFDLKRARIPTPPLKEQKAIAAVLDTATRKFDELITEAQRAIDLLQERRTALISAAVTGQIDVRAIANRAAA